MLWECKDIASSGASSRGMEPSMESFDGAVLICDITGFTQLTEQLSKQGPSGVEQLTKCMNNYFTKVLCGSSKTWFCLLTYHAFAQNTC